MSAKDAKIKLILRFGEGKNVKPGNVLEKLLKNEDNYAKIYKIRRTNLYIETSSGELYEP
jgi:hypothetical protein